MVAKSYVINGEKLPGFGYATYRLKVITDKSIDDLALKIDTVSTAYNLFINVLNNFISPFS